jgi:three-Cys-motif partner protein
MYYFVELKKKLAEKLKELIEEKYPQKETYVVVEDCNKKLVSLAKFLKSEKGKKYKVLAFIDPKGMQVNWKSLEILKDLPIDLWILTPTGVGTNRLLKKDGNISDSWLRKLEDFLGMPSKEILEKFYSLSPQISLFGTTEIIKERNAIEKIHQVYKSRLTTIFTHVSDAFVLRNSSNSIMYHFFMATNNDIALKIANSVVKPKYQ